MDAFLIPHADQSNESVRWTTTFCKLSQSVNHLWLASGVLLIDEHGRLVPVILPVPAHREADAECMS